MRTFVLALALLALASIASADPSLMNAAIFDTTVTTSASSDTIRFGGISIGGVTGEVSASADSIAWYQDYAPLPGYGKIGAKTVPTANYRRKGVLLVNPSKKWLVAAGQSFSYANVRVSGLVWKGTGAGKLHVQAIIWVNP
jgi:hypothetical protein